MKKRCFDIILEAFLWTLNSVLIVLTVAVLIFPIIMAYETGNHWVLLHLLYTWIPSLFLGIASFVLFMVNLEILEYI